MRVQCGVEAVQLDGDYTTVPGVCVTCTRCDKTARVFGRSGASVRRGLVMLREERPMGESNYYVAETED